MAGGDLWPFIVRGVYVGKSESKTECGWDEVENVQIWTFADFVPWEDIGGWTGVFWFGCRI